MPALIHSLTIAALKLSEEEIRAVVATRMAPTALAQQALLDYWLALAFAVIALALALAGSRSSRQLDKLRLCASWWPVSFFFWGIHAVQPVLFWGFTEPVLFHLHVLSAVVALFYLLLLWLVCLVLSRPRRICSPRLSIRLEGAVVAIVITTVFADFVLYFVAYSRVS